MRKETFYIESYLRPGDATHVAHKELSRRWPERAHDHDYFELFLIEHGETEHWINGTTQHLTRGDLVFIRPDDAHAFRGHAQRGCRIFNVMFRQDTIIHFNARYPDEFSGRFFDCLGMLPDSYALPDTELERAFRLAERLLNGTLSRASVEEFLLALVNQVLSSRVAVTAHMPNWLAEACKALRNPNVFKRGTPGFVEVAGRSHEHLCRSCREFLDTTPSAYVNRVRSDYAAERLVRTHLPIASISAEVGIDNIGHFYRVFRAHFGTTPRAYRLTHQKDPFE